MHVSEWTVFGLERPNRSDGGLLRVLTLHRKNEIKIIIGILPYYTSIVGDIKKLHEMI